ncbi:energy transducer TonB [Porticoccus sp.]|uniref:energy transducer TonB n=1 Tax=Porticoccus sp. TaxID=2024853 RepID=UPI000C5A857B|nr:energy transducer TonB [Porticoccus sp.]MAZ70744.1 energy transducer TonB [Porticoccus sp.]|tara:strand:+ start:21716 stop:22321 length:606 start_codon:yes stop_codon:yes gene_type:complete
MVLMRYALAAVLGLIMTLALLLGMHGLITSSGGAEPDRSLRKIADIWQPQRTIEEHRKVIRPEKPREAERPPPPVPDLQVNIETPKGPVDMMTPAMEGLQVGLGGSFTRDSDYIPVYVPQPDYPPMALRQGVEGYAVVEVVITVTGSVRDVKLLEESPANKGFGKYALRAAEKLKYKPRVIDGKAEEVAGVLYKFSFQIAR